MTGTRGPVSKRPEERRRRNKPENEGRAPETPSQGYWNFEVPEPPFDDEGVYTWHPLVVDLYFSIQQSGQSEWYQLSDWMALQIACESMSRDLDPQFVGMQTRWNREAQDMETVPTKMRLPLKGANLGAYLKLFGALGVTEGDRRRMGIMLQRAAGPVETPEEKAKSVVTDARERFRGGA